LHHIFIGIDEVGEFPWHVREGEELPTEGMRWRLVAQTDDDEEAVEIMALVSRRCRSRKGSA